MRHSVRRLLAPEVLLGAVAVGFALGALAEGVLDGPTWLLVVGLTATAVALSCLGAVAERGQGGGVAAGLRSGGPRAYAPALVHSVRAVHRDTGQLVLDPQAAGSLFAFDLTVVPEGRRPFRVEVRHPLDVQDLLHRSRAVVEYDPRQPWRVVLPNRPPPEWAARAQRLDPEAAHTTEGPPAGLPPGAHVLVTGAVVAAGLLGVLHLAG
ncbi:hypothetical protein [Streptomyces flavofungini]|uniref:Integral membrane protein n=1 Tax=Streptomyces flavofungini TaxID=68200 RepID=A0ABS0XGD9_9ACTN|nr:hypothetical protein [Streptomyces flavofungini]MBJ3811939.1 hypothetical protein [Streptomyces flavofungini]GHC52311.1 hypothetical protein GCM10010349_17870 [Streptomyces flavofungini]